jgi:hypothetical protein
MIAEAYISNPKTKVAMVTEFVAEGLCDECSDSDISLPSVVKPPIQI